MKGIGNKYSHSDREARVDNFAYVTSEFTMRF